jgi:phage terminase large subunit
VLTAIDSESGEEVQDFEPRGLDLPVAEAFVPLLEPSRYKGIFGGRGGAKSHFFGDQAIERCLLAPTRIVCVREIQKSLEQSVKRLLEDKIRQYELQDEFEILNNEIRTPGGGLIIFQGMQNHTADSIKSLEGYDIAWVEEAQTLSQRSLDLLRPTIRKPGSELWFSWNPRFPTDPVDSFFRGNDREDKSKPHVPPPNSIIVETHFDSNPWFPDVLETDMLWDRQRDPEKYGHIWRGGYLKKSGTRIYRNWREEEFETPSSVEAFYLGGDWGYAADPNVLIRTWLRDPRTLMIDFEAHGVGVELEETPALFDRVGCLACALGDPCPGAQHEVAVRRGELVCERCSVGGVCPELFVNGHAMARNYVVTADSARPETISYMQRHGYPRLQAAKKGPGSLEDGITFLKNYNMVVHPRCVHTIDELTFYSWKTDPLTEQVLPVPVDKKNHVMDSLRYAVEALRRRKAKVFGGRRVKVARTMVVPSSPRDLDAATVSQRPQRRRMVY